jgi:hypothetical protein
MVGRPPLFARLSTVIRSGTLDMALVPLDVIALILWTALLSEASVVAVACATKF